MTFQIPKKEPAQLRAGDTWEWRREDISNFPATDWTLTYRFKNAVGGFEIVANADGAFYSVSVDAATTAALAPGDYSWQAQVSDVGGEKHTIENGDFTVLPSFFATSATTGYDDRSVARKALDAIDAQLQGRATSDQAEYEIQLADRSLRRVRRATIMQLIQAKQYYEGLVAAEEAAKRAEAGLPDKRRTYVRFSRCW